MKFSICILIFMIPIFLGCEKRPKRLLVRPVEKDGSDTIYSTIFPFEKHPCIHFGKKWENGNTDLEVPDTLFSHRIRINQISKIKLDAGATFPAVPLDVEMPDSVRLGDVFYYLVVLKAQDGAMFSRMHMEEISKNCFQIRAYQQKVKGLSWTRSKYEETMRSFYPLEKGVLQFEYFFYDSLLLTKEVVVY